MVIDNTNPDEATRKYWVDLAREVGVGIRCVHFVTEGGVCRHNDVVRALNMEVCYPVFPPPSILSPVVCVSIVLPRQGNTLVLALDAMAGTRRLTPPDR